MLGVWISAAIHQQLVGKLREHLRFVYKYVEVEPIMQSEGMVSINNELSLGDLAIII